LIRGVLLPQALQDQQPGSKEKCSGWNIGTRGASCIGTSKLLHVFIIGQTHINFFARIAHAAGATTLAKAAGERMSCKRYGRKRSVTPAATLKGCSDNWQAKNE